jgi:Flp pilus assembly protein TadD
VDPKYDRPYTNLGNLYKKMGRNDEALVLYLKSVELNPKGDAVYNSLGLLYHTNK